MASFFTSWTSFQPLKSLSKDVSSLNLVELSGRMAELIDAQPEVGAMIHFLAIEPIHNLEPIVRHITDVLIIFASPQPDCSAIQRMQSDHPGLLANKVIHPCWIFLWMAAFLAYSSKTIAELFVRSQVDRLVEDFYTNEFPGYMPDSDDSHQTQKLLLCFVCHLLLSSIDKHHEIDSPVMLQLLEKLQKEDSLRVIQHFDRLGNLHAIFNPPSEMDTENLSPEKQKRLLQQRSQREQARDVVAKRLALEAEYGPAFMYDKAVHFY